MDKFYELLDGPDHPRASTLNIDHFSLSAFTSDENYEYMIEFFSTLYINFCYWFVHRKFDEIEDFVPLNEPGMIHTDDMNAAAAALLTEFVYDPYGMRVDSVKMIED